MSRPAVLSVLLGTALLLASCGRVTTPAASARVAPAQTVTPTAPLSAQALPDPQDRLYARDSVTLPVVQKNGKKVGEVRVRLDIAKVRSGYKRFSGVGEVTVTSTALQEAQAEASVTLFNPDGSVRSRNETQETLRPDDFFGSDLFHLPSGRAAAPADLGTRPYCAETRVRVTFANRAAAQSARFLAPVQTQLRVCSGQGELPDPLADVAVQAALTAEAGGVRPSVSVEGAPEGYSISGQFTYTRNDGTCGSLLPGTENVVAPRNFESLTLSAQGQVVRGAPADLTLVPVIHLYDDDGIMVEKNLDAPWPCLNGPADEEAAE